MRTEDLPFVKSTEAMRNVVMAMTAGRCGTAIVVEDEQLVGVITDGDLRRAFHKFDDTFELSASDVMTQDPIVIVETATLGEAEELMRTHRIKTLLAVNGSGMVKGVVELYSK
jgi:arabinose-5-phosphate isomerase